MQDGVARPYRNSARSRSEKIFHGFSPFGFLGIPCWDSCVPTRRPRSYPGRIYVVEQLEPRTVGFLARTVLRTITVQLLIVTGHVPEET